MKLDKKDYKILKELDKNFRHPFSRIGKKVGLSKNSVRLRFKKLKKLTLHNTVGINNELIGYRLVKIFYSFDFFDKKLEKRIEKNLKKNSNILWASRLYGQYDLGIGIIVKNLDTLISQVSDFNESFSSKINQKEMQIIYRQIYMRNNFLHKKPINKKYKIIRGDTISLNENEKKFLVEFKNNPRMNLVDLAEKLNLSLKTVSDIKKKMEKKEVITGYFMTINPEKFGYSKFKLLLQLKNLKDYENLEDYLSSVKNNCYITKMLGLWDYEVDGFYKDVHKLQKKIEDMKKNFKNRFKKISIISLGKRIATNKGDFLK